MQCPICDSNIPDDTIVCPHCGETVSALSKKKKVKKIDKSNKINETKTAKKVNNKFKTFKVIFGLTIILALVLTGTILIVSSLPSEGEKIFESVSEKLGRSIEIAQNNAGVKLEKDSEYNVLHEIVNYDYIYTDEKTTKVGGVNLPKWAVYVQTIEALKDSNRDENAEPESMGGDVVNGKDEDLNDLINKDDEVKAPTKEVIDTVTYYNFEVLNKNWKGQKTDEAIDANLITYGLTKKKVDKIVDLDPLFVRRSTNDITTYCYKYYFVDEDTGDEKAMYLEVNYAVDNTVKSATSRKNDYIAFLFK